MKEISVLFVDDHPLIIEGYKTILSYKIDYSIKFFTCYNLEDSFKICSENVIDIIILDVNFPLENYEIHDGCVAAIKLKHIRPNAKILVITSHCEGLILYNLFKLNLEGIIVKSDLDGNVLNCAFNDIVTNQTFYSSTVRERIAGILSHQLYLDNYNRQIITLLAKGIKTKNLPLHLPLSISAIDKRKVQIKNYFNVLSCDDEELLRVVRELGFI